MTQLQISQFPNRRLFSFHSSVAALVGLVRGFATCLLFVIAAIAVRGQVTSGSLSGIVQDNSGAVVPDAAVVLKNELTNSSRSTTSNSTGVFTFSAVPPGRYSVTVAHAGFETFNLNQIVLEQGEDRTIPRLCQTSTREPGLFLVWRIMVSPH